MAFYQDTQTLCAVMTELFQRVMATPSARHQLRRTGLMLRMPADVLHRVWLSEIRLRDAYLSGQIKVEGSLVRAFALAHLFRQVEALYPTVLQDRSLLPGSRPDRNSG